MKKSGAWLTVYALEQLGVRHTFGIPGVQNTEIYDALDNSERITPILVVHEGGGAFMADAVSRTSSAIGTLVTVPAAGLTHAASGIGEAFLDGVPMLVLSGGVRTDTGRRYQVHQMDIHAFMRGITKATFRIERQDEIVPTLFKAYDIAVSGEPGPVYVEIPLNLQAFTAEIGTLPVYLPKTDFPPLPEAKIDEAVRLLSAARKPGLFVGWGARHAGRAIASIAEKLGAPVATTLQGLATFPGDHPLHAGFGFGAAAVPAARRAFEGCDCLLAVGTRFSEIATGSYSVSVPETLIHLDINPQVFSANYPARLTIEGDAKPLLDAIAERLAPSEAERGSLLAARIGADKEAYRRDWYGHDREGKVNPARFFDGLKAASSPDAITVLDDGNHTFLAAELFTIREGGQMILPTDFNSMGYAVPAGIGAKLANPQREVNVVVGDGAFGMTGLELLTAGRNGLGLVVYVFHDGMLSQIAQFQKLPYNRATCTEIGAFALDGVARATNAAYLAMPDNASIAAVMAEANRLARDGRPVVVDVAIDYDKPTAFTTGAGRVTFARMPWGAKARILTRAIARRMGA